MHHPPEGQHKNRIALDRQDVPEGQRGLVILVLSHSPGRAVHGPQRGSPLGRLRGSTPCRALGPATAPHALRWHRDGKRSSVANGGPLDRTGVYAGERDRVHSPGTVDDPAHALEAVATAGVRIPHRARGAGTHSRRGARRRATWTEGSVSGSIPVSPWRGCGVRFPFTLEANRAAARAGRFDSCPVHSADLGVGALSAAR